MKVEIPEERPKTPSQMKVEEWKTGNKLYEITRKNRTWENYLKSIGKEYKSKKS